MKFAKDVRGPLASKLTIQVHDNASLFKAPEIKRAVQGGQAQAGEILLVNFQNEWPMWGLDSILSLYQLPRALQAVPGQQARAAKRNWASRA